MRILKFLARLVFVIACVVAIALLWRSFTAEAGTLGNLIDVNNRQAALRSNLPGTATAIFFDNGTLAVQRTNQPTNTPTPTEPPEPTDLNAPDTSYDPDGSKTPTPGVSVNFDYPAASFREQITTDTPVPTTAPTKPGAISTNTPRPTVAISPTATTLPPTIAATSAPLPTGGTPLKVPTVPLYQIPTVSRAQPTGIPTAMARLKANNNDIVNIILIGSDQDVDPSDRSFRTDSMLIVSINRTANTVSMLSLPRDLYVYIPTQGMQRLNTAFGTGEIIGFQPGGGFGLLQQTVLYNFGIPLHYYARLSLNGFKTIIDSLNGIDVAVDCPITDLRYQGPVTERTPEPSEYTNFTLQPGFYHMNGSLALWYSRVRKNTSDFDRSRRQQQVLRAMWKTGREQNLVVKIPELWGPISGVVTTNLTLPDVLSLAPVAISLKPGDIRTFYMQKGYELDHFAAPGADVQIPALPGFLETLNRFYTPPTTNKTNAENFSIEVINGTQVENMDKVAVDRLTWGGFDATAKGTGAITPKTVVYDYTGSAKPATLTAMLKALNVKQSAVVSQPDPNRTVDFRVIIGADYNSCSAAGFAK
jgi:LCP family protein required for cell wall assembly